MNISNLQRRRFLQSAFFTSLAYGSGATPGLLGNALAAPAAINQRMLINLFLSGGPDMRHFVVPAYNPVPDSFGNKYWKHRWRAHQLSETDQSTWQARWEQDYYPITVGGQGWNSGLVDPGNLNAGETFGIWREAGWLIDMFRAGHVALIFNAVGGTNRAHDLSSLMLNQGNVLSTLNDQDRSGWGGRVARSAGGTALSLTNSPSEFLFGPLGAAPGYDPDAIDNKDLISVDDSRQFGLFDFNIEQSQYTNEDFKMARAAKSYYAGLRQEQIATAYEKVMSHEFKVRQFGELIRGRLDTVPIPELIEALYSNGMNDSGGTPINPQPGADPAVGRRVLRSTGFGRQIRNLYDVLAANDLLGARVMSMSYGGWDSHGSQRRVPGVLASDPHNPFESRGIESGLKDIFGGQFGNSPVNPGAWHGGFSALWESIPSGPQRRNLALTIAGEFGRQIRDNGDAGTDHGKGNLIFVISESCQGGVYGEMFQDAEVDKYDNASLRTPDIDPRSEIDSFFSKVADWAVAGSGSQVFPRTAPGFTGAAPTVEQAGLFDNLMSG